MGKITEIIDEAAFSQFAKLLALTKEAQTDFTGLVETVSKLTTELGKASSMKEFEVTVTKAEKATDALAEANKKVEQTSKKAAEAEEAVIQAAKVRASTMAESKKMLDVYSGSLDENIRQQLQIKLVLQENAARQKQLTKDYKDGKVGAEQYAKELEDLNRVQVEGKKALTDYNLEVRRALKENAAATGSYDELTATLDRLRGLYRRLSEEERESAEIGGVLVKQIQEYDKTLKDLDKSIGVTNRNVGNYTESITDALDATGLFSDQMQFLAKAKQIYQAGAKAATTATQSFGLSLKAAGIGIILTLLAAVVTYFTKFQGGADKAALVMAKVGAAVDVLVGYFGKLGEQIVENALPALRGVWDVLAGLATFDFERVKAGFNGVSDAISNIEPIRITEVAGAMAEAAREAEKLKNAEKALEVASIAATREQAKLTKELEYYQAIADDATLSFEEQRKANLAALDIQQKLSNTTVSLAKQEEALVNQRVEMARKNGTLTRALEKEQAEATAKRIEAESGLTQAVLANGRQRRQLKQDELERDLDILIDGFDNQKTVNERLIANERLSFQEREKILDETKKLADGSFEEQIKTIQKFTDAKVNADDLVNESDARVLNQKIRSLGLSEIIEGRLLEIVRERRLAVADLNEAEADLAEEKAEKTKEAEEKALEAQKEALAKRSAIVLAGLEVERDEALRVLSEQFQAGEISAKDYANRRLEIQRQFSAEYVQAEIDELQKLIDFNKAIGLDTFEQEKQLAALKLRLSEETTNKQIEDAERLAEVERELAERRGELLQEVAALAIQVVNQRFEKELETVNAQKEAVEAQKEAEIERANETITNERERNVKIAQIEATAAKKREQLAEREKAIKQRQARFEKLANAAAIVSNTARAITAQLAITPLPIGAPLVAIIAAIGAVQLAQALAVPIPEYYKGTKNAKEGLAWVGERGAELRIEPDGTQSLTPAKPTLTWLKQGTQIIPAGETQKRLADAAVSYVKESDTTPGLSTKALEDAYRKETRRLGDKLSKKPERVTTITAGGAKHLLKSASGWTEYIGRNL